MLLQPYLENSLRHGIRYKEDGLGVVKIHFAKLDNRLLCIITDNGIGRAKAASYKGQQAIQYQSKGMNLTAKRIELLNKMNESNITIKIIDLLNDAGNGIGTQVILNLKI